MPSLPAWLLAASLRIAIIAVAAYIVIRAGSAATRRFERQMSTGTGLEVIERTKRAQTFSRLLQRTLSVVITVMAGLMILRELDIDITPVLTGAGIAGLAIGFGAQTLVRDVISGFFMIFEDQVRVGDVVMVNGQGGLVEEVKLRTIVLRDEHGAVHIFPNGEVKTLSNLSKDFSYYVITIGVGFDDDVERASDAMVDAAAALMREPDFMPYILAPLEVLGIDSFEGGHLVIKARIKTVPLKQWVVGRELRRRIAREFKNRGIHLPTPRMVVEMRQDKSEAGSKKSDASQK
jgi:small conductance mechanosensitive channel